MITGALSLGLVLGGSRHAGKVIAWVGTALWAAYAVGAPAGTALYASHGFAAIALATMLLPLLALFLVAPLRTVPAPASARPPSITRVLGAVAVPGLGMALTAVGFGTITTFGALMFSERGWSSAWVAFTAVSIFFILGRVVFGHLPDKLGGARAPPESRGLAMGAFTAFLDLSLGVANPALGQVAGRTGLASVFLVSTVVVLCASVIAVRLLRAPRVAAIVT